MKVKLAFTAIICASAMAILLFSRILGWAENPDLDILLAKIVFLSLGVLLIAWNLNKK